MEGSETRLGADLRERLARVPLFARLGEQALDALVALARPRALKRKAYLFQEGDLYRGPYVVLGGLAVVFKVSAQDGRMLVLHVCRPGAVLAEMPLFEGPPGRYPAYARVTRDSEVVLLPREPFTAFLRDHPEVTWELARGLAARLKELTLQLESVTLREVTSRVARYLLREVEAAGKQGEARPVLTLPLAKGSLAAYLGMVHETFSRTLSRLVKDRIVSVKGSEITILDVERLRRLE